MARQHLHHVHRRGAVPQEPVKWNPAKEFRMPSIRSVLSKRVNCNQQPSSPQCQKPSGEGSTAPIVLAAVIPIVVAIVVLFFIHRYRVKKQRQEDAKDPHKSLDFGLDIAPSGKTTSKGGAGVPEMSLTQTHDQLRGRGLSMNMDSPYLLPAGLNHSRESFRSMSRSMHDPNDPYRPVTFIKNGETGSMAGSAANSMRSYPRGLRSDNASTFTDSSVGTDGMNANLLRNAQRMSRSYPARQESMPPMVPEAHKPGEPHAPLPPAPAHPAGGREASPLSASHQPGASPGLRQDDDTARKLEGARPPTIITPDDHRGTETPRLQSMEAAVHQPGTASFLSDSSYGDGFKVTPPSPPRHGPVPPPINTAAANRLPEPPTRAEPPPSGLGVQGVEQPSNRLSLIVRPLPAEDPAEDPESRANRIRSFYKEYFDDSKGGDAAAAYDDSNYYADDYYDGEYYTDGAIFDPQSGQFVVAGAPFAEPVTRRAMTPPPRAPPRFRGPGGPGGPRGSGGPRGPRGHNSSGSMQYPRGHSAMSHRPPPKKRLPPPQPLQSLPTPHLIKEDSMTFNALDFAPPTTFRDRQAGRRPDSPLGVSRPYSPSVAAHVPLASPYSDLSAMPSPHMLRRSGTFTALDFAPPPRFKNSDGGSDAGSIRSNRSGMSSVQVASLRAGAYRVSRIPKEVVGTTGEMGNALKPQWDMRGKP